MQGADNVRVNAPTPAQAEGVYKCWAEILKLFDSMDATDQLASLELARRIKKGDTV